MTKEAAFQWERLLNFDKEAIATITPITSAWLSNI